MNVGNSIRRAIDEWEADELDSAMLHACNAVDGTSKKLHPSLGSNTRFTRLLRDNYGIFGPMGAPGIDLSATRFPVRLQSAKALGGQPDIADVIYGIHRCSHGHGDELPDGFQLLADAKGRPRYTHMIVERGKVHLSDRVIFGLIAVAVMSPVNRGQRVPDGYQLTFGANVTLMINDWWGRAADFAAIASTEPLPMVTLDFGDWMREAEAGEP